MLKNFRSALCRVLNFVPALVFTVLTATIMYSCKENNPIIYLKNKDIQVGVHPELGGRLVFFGRPDGNNMLLSDESLWNDYNRSEDEPSPKNEFKPYNGMITWVGPQSRWWTQQNRYPDKLKRKDIWPPDPFAELARYNIIQKTEHTLLIESEASPITGLSFRKFFKLNGHSLEIEVRALNERDTTVYWDLWTNARFEAFTTFFVPGVPSSEVRIDAVSDDMKAPMPYCVDRGFFTFYPERSETKHLVSKAFIHETPGHIAVVKNDDLMVMEFNRVAKDSIHPDQAFIEVYNSVSTDGTSDLLELEHHSAYKAIAPNETIKLTEQWNLIELPENFDIENAKNIYSNRF